MEPVLKPPEEGKPSRYAKRRSSFGRVLWGLFAIIWALIFCLLAVLRLDISHPTSLIWTVILFALALVSAYGGLYFITSWWEAKKEKN